MDKLELAIATDYLGESTRTEDLEHILKMVSEAGFTHIHWCHEWDGEPKTWNISLKWSLKRDSPTSTGAMNGMEITPTLPMKWSRFVNGWINTI